MSVRPYLIPSLSYGSVFAAAAVGVGLGTIQWYLSSHNKDEKEDIAEFRAMTNLNKTCRACIYQKRCCIREENCSYAILCWIIDFINSATETIDAAIYLITCMAFKDAFLAAHNRGVHIRFLSDSVMAYGTGSAIPAFLSNGINVRFAPAEERHMMHRKSVVIDKKCILSGTANWTMQSLCGNWDGFMKTNKRSVVEAFLNNFENEWKQLDPENLQLLLVEQH